MKNKLKVIIADDEPEARHSIEVLLSKQDDIEIIRTVNNGPEALEVILNQKPDLVFLDIQMPGMDGFEVLEKLQHTFMPTFIFVTAFDRYAVRAFEKSAVDYLLKPYDDERFYQSLDKARNLIALNKTRQQIERIEDLLQSIQAPQMPETVYQERLPVKNHGKITFLPVNTIVYLEAEGNFVKIFTESGMKISGYTFKQLEQLLNPVKFVRIHKSFMVNIDQIESLEPYFHGDYSVSMKTGAQLKMSRNFKDSLKTLFT